MRLRNTTVAALGAFTLLLAAPNSASATQGNFEYTLTSGSAGVIVDPPSGACFDISGSTEADPARGAANYTDSAATVFPETGCGGDVQIVMGPGEKLGGDIAFRSVVFGVG